MASDPNRTAFRQIDRLFQGGSVTGLDEGQLLDRFVADRDELALEALIEWHGPMVLGVCRRWLANPHDVDDAFQATFLILVRKARSLRDVHRLGPWLHGVAYRVAVRARTDAARRRALEQSAARAECEFDIHAPERLALRAELRGLVDEEVARLPASLRTAIVVCDLEGQSQHDAARLLGWSEGALRGRLARARQKLRDRLERRGVAPALLPAGAPLLSAAIPTSLTQSLIAATTRAATASLLAGRASPSATTVISASVAALVQGVIHAMTLSKVKMLGLAVILAAIGLFAVDGFVRAGLSKDETDPAPRHSVLAEARAGGQSPTTGVEEAKARTLDFRLVRRSDKQPISGAVLEVSTHDQDSWHETTLSTDNQGHCSIELPRATSVLAIWVAKDGFVPISRSWNERDLRRVTTETYTQDLEPGEPIGGFVKDEQGRPIEGAKVTVAISHRKDDVPDADVPVPASLSAYAGFPHIRVKTDAHGFWRCSILPVNADPETRLWFFLEHPDYVSDTGGYSRRLSLKTARAMTGTLFMNPGVKIGGQVRDGADKPVTGAMVVLAYSGNSEDGLKTTTDAEGRYRFTHAKERGGLGRWSLSAQAPGFAPSWKMIVPIGEIPQADFRLARGQPFRGRVVDHRGQPVAGVTVSARWEECYSLDWKVETDAEGRFVWPDAPGEGEIAFELRKAGYSVALDRSVSAAAGQAELTINPPIRARGKVVDAESKQLIPSFTAIPATRFRDDREIVWQRSGAVKGREGQYELAVSRRDQPGTLFHVLIEAEGYAMATSRPMKPDEGEVTLDFAMKKANGISGVVRLPDGKPASGADVYIDGLGFTYDRTGPGPAPGEPTRLRRKTDPEGHYALPPRDEPFGILVVHDKGFGDRTAEEMARSGDVILKPWARIEGTFRIRGKPGIHQEIDIDLNRSVIVPSYRSQSFGVTTDDQGRFVLDRIMDGEAIWTWSSGERGRMARSSAGPAVHVRPGQTLHVDLGGQGRPMIGQLVLSTAEGARQGDAIAPVNLANAHGRLETKPSGMPIPPDFMTWDAQKRQSYKIKWYHTGQGKAYLRDRRYHIFPIGADGRFRIEDVVPGSYSIRITVQSTPGMRHALTRNRLEGRIERDVEVGAIPGGRSDEPLDIGRIPLKLEFKN